MTNRVLQSSKPLWSTRMRLSTIVTLTTRFAVASGLTLASIQPQTAAAQNLPRFERGDCPFVAGERTSLADVECGALIVPETREQPNGRTVRLAVAILRAQGHASAPPLVYIQGRYKTTRISFTREVDVPAGAGREGAGLFGALGPRAFIAKRNAGL